MKKFIEELKRRNVIKSALAYLVVAWILQQVFTNVAPILGAPDWVLQVLLLILVIGLPIWIVISWIYELTPQGIEKTTKDSGSELVTQVTNKRLNVFIIVSLSIAVIVLTLKLTNVFEDSNKQYAIAVLPFKDMSPEDTQWFCDGVMDEILNHFSTLKSLRVISRTSSDTYKGTKKKIPEIAKELDVDYVLEGSVTLHNNKVKIMAQLIKANDEHIWSKDYKSDFVNIFEIQQNVSKDIFKKLKITLSPEEKEAIERIPTQNMEAYQLVLKGRSIVGSIKKEDLEKSIKLYKHAIILDPNYAEAYAEIAQSYNVLNKLGFMNFDLSLNKANSYIDKALKIDPNSAKAYAVKAVLEWRIYKDWESAKDIYEKAIALNPNDAVVHYQYAGYLNNKPVKDINKSLKHYRIAQQLDPFSFRPNNFLFYTLVMHDRFEEAEEHLKKWGFVYSEISLLSKESRLKTLKYKNWKESIRFFETKIEKDSNNAVLYSLLSDDYAQVLYDKINAIKYAKKAYELDSTKTYYALGYMYKLVRANKFEEANKFLKRENIKTLINKKQELDFLFYYYYYQGNYKKAQEVLTDSLLKESNLERASNYAQLGEREKVDSLLEDIEGGHEKAIVYAILQERDSMYHHLEKLHNFYVPATRAVNSHREFDPYRKEERFKAFLKKNYLPITQWNE